MTQRVSVPEKTLEHWASMYVTYRYRSKAALWWPARGEDVDIGMLPAVPGKAVQLELKTTTPAGIGTGLHDVNVDLGQLWRYSRRAPARQPFYVFPWPDWDGNLADVARAVRKEVTELAFRRSRSPWWFAEWMVVLTTRQVADVLRRELKAHASTARCSERLVRIDFKDDAKTVWGGKNAPAPAPRPDVIGWLDFWDELDQCGRDGWPQLIRAPRFMAERLREHAAGPEGRSRYGRQEIAALLRQSTDVAGEDRGGLPLVTFEPDENGEYRITEDPSDEQTEPAPDDDAADVPDDNRQVVFLDSRALFHE